MILDFASSMSGITNADSVGDQVRRKICSQGRGPWVKLVWLDQLDENERATIVDHLSTCRLHRFAVEVTELCYSSHGDWVNIEDIENFVFVFHFKTFVKGEVSNSRGMKHLFSVRTRRLDEDYALELVNFLL